MHDGMPYGPIQGQGHVALQVRNSSIFNIYRSLPPFSTGAGKWVEILKLEENSKFVQAGFLISRLVFESHDFKIWRKSMWRSSLAHRRSRPSVPLGADFYLNFIVPGKVFSIWKILPQQSPKAFLQCFGAPSLQQHKQHQNQKTLRPELETKTKNSRPRLRPRHKNSVFIRWMLTYFSGLASQFWVAVKLSDPYLFLIIHAS